MRTRGAKDLKKRKSRRLKTRKYSKKNGKFIPYKSKRDRNSAIKIWFWERIPMSKEGYSKWPKMMRPRLKKVVTKFNVRVDVPPERLSTPENIEELALETIGYEGNFLLMLFAGRKNKGHCSPVKCANIKIIETSDGLIAKCSNYSRLSKYKFFWKGK